MKRSVLKLILVGLFVISIILISSCRKHQSEMPAEEDIIPEEILQPVSHIQKVEYINGNRQVINILKVDLRCKEATIIPVLSQDSIFGFEKTSVMANRKDAFAAVNGGFFYSYGQPSGLIIIDGKLLATGLELVKRPVFAINEHRKVIIEDIDIQLFLNIYDKDIPIDGINREPRQDEIIIFTPEYGLDTRLIGENIFNSIIKNGHISETIFSKEKVKIPRDGSVIVATGNKVKDYSELLDKIKAKADILYKISPDYGRISQALEGGFWVVKNGKNVMSDKEPWVGLMTNREPRTIVGMQNDHTVVFVTIDGRQPGYSIGVNGEELAEYLLSQNIYDAIMLDGGASTTMVLENQIINNPSYRGRERMLGGAIIIKLAE